jgi:hypothetical protein
MVGDQNIMGRELDIPWTGSQNTMGRGLIYHGYGIPCTMGRVGQNTMGR